MKKKCFIGSAPDLKAKGKSRPALEIA